MICRSRRLIASNPSSLLPAKKIARDRKLVQSIREVVATSQLYSVAMSQKQAAGPTPEAIFGAANAFQISFALKGAIDLDLFTAIGEGNTDAASLAKRCSASEKGCRILCDFLTVQGHLTKADGKWGLTPQTAAFLDKRSPAYLGSAFDFLHTPEIIGSFMDVAGIIRKGGALKGEGSVEPDNPIWVKFARGMAPMMMFPAQDIPMMVGPVSGKVLDIAAGHGLFGIEVAKKNSEASVVALDWAAVLEVAKENAQSAGVSDRYSTIAGSAFDSDLGSGYELVLLTNFLHHFDRATCVGLLRRVHAALKPGGRAVTLEFVPNEDRVTPPPQAAFAFQMLANTSGGDAYTFPEYESMFSEAGFASTTMQDMPRAPERLLISTR